MVFNQWMGYGLLLLAVGPVAANELFTYRSAESEQDTRNRYDMAVLQLALDKTRATYGDYQLEASPPMNTVRAMQELEKGTYPNFIIKMSYSPDYERNSVERGTYEIDLGIIGYRVCFTRESLLPELATIHTLAGWQRYLHGQGTGWMDVNILKYNGFKVTEVATYKSLFPMVAKGRFDLFCRGINEVIDEWPEASQQPELVLEPTMMLYYDLPRFFYTNSRDAKGLARVEEGLQLAAADGSLLDLWKQYYLPSVKYVQPQKRHLFRLINPDVHKIKWAPRQWVYEPISGKFHYRDQ